MIHRAKVVITFLLINFVGSLVPAYSAEPLLQFANAEQADLYQLLTEEFRCLKCQNQNLADSNAGLAQDLRNEIYQAVLKGQSRDEIANYLVARYGDFVLYRPPIKKATYLLWFGPFLLLLFAIVGAWLFIVKKPVSTSTSQVRSDALEDARRRLND